MSVSSSSYESSHRLRSASSEPSAGRPAKPAQTQALHRQTLGAPNRAGETAHAAWADLYFTVDSPVGAVYVVAGRGGVRFIDQAGSPGDLADRYRARFGRSLSAPLGDAAPAQSETVAAALRGEPVEVVVDLAGLTPFQRRILEVTAGVPRGQVRSYAWVAREAGVPGAARAAGNALASNPVPLLVPCHRVVNSDGRTGRYAFGAHAKRRLLELEGVSLQEIALAPYVASRATSVLCHATCGRARALSAAERQPFRSAREAAAAGYRPCTDCRPA